ncbi:MAG: PEP-CTERM sorting domain-containing protein [Leptothrix sp. (in: Bacteria)]|nr:PEP-CTERM sorting domain-containing protein [Leptothrix sp. (in: b-proteobacteria)]
MNARLSIACAIVAAGFLAAPAQAAPAFVNGLVLDADGLDASGGTLVNNGRLGFFSDIYYDAKRDEWWALSDRGPGGGTLRYHTRMHQFKIDVDPATGTISNFQILKTLVFRRGGSSLDGFAPEIAGPLGLAFDPEGVVVNPRTGHFLISDEYGPSLLEVNRAGQVVRRYDTPANLVPRNAATGVANYAGDDGNTAGKRTNRGFEGLAISPDGRTAYAMLQSAMLDEGGGSGTLNRIVAFDTRTARPLAQYAYRMDGSSQGRGISALVALNDHEFLVLERNNRGLGVDGELTPANKKVFRIDLAGATDVSAINLATAPAGSFVPVTKTATPWLDLAAAATLTHPSLAALGGVSPEKWEGLTVGPRLNDGSYLLLAGTDNDYSVTQNGSPVQLDVYFKVMAGVTSRIQCTIGTFDACITINANGSLGSAVAPGFDFTGYRKIPGVLHAYKASAADLAGLVRPLDKD